MDQRRQLLSFVLMLGIVLVWFNVAPLLFPHVFKRPDPQAPPADAAAVDKVGDAANEIGRPAPATADEPAPSGAQSELAVFPARTVFLGDPARGDLQRLELTSRGAAIESQTLTEQQYRTLDRKAQLQLLGNSPLASAPKTLAIDSPQFDGPLAEHETSLANVDWELVEADSRRIPDTEAWERVTFRFPSPDGAWEVRKTFALQESRGIDPKENPTGYLVDVTLTFRRLTEGPAELTYTLQGPVGLPLENEENTRTFRTVKGGLLTSESQDSVSAVSEHASSLVTQVNKAQAAGNPGDRPVWRYPVRWAGVDVQYFAALLIPAENQVADADRDGKPDGYFAEVVPTVVQEVLPVERSDVSVVFKSHPLNLPDANAETTHTFQLYLGPKRVELLDSFQAQSIMDFGWFAPIARGMVALLSFFHNSLLLPYGLAIVLLTVIVRGALFPLSKKQVANVQKMKDLNPKLVELKAKYADDKEALARAQWEFMKKHGYNPLAGCLPIFLQLPIFIGLYNGLNTAIDLRLAQFMWINNLAAPDALFQFPFRVPYFGTAFNLLPLLTVVLFIIQNKLFTPPPTNEEQAMQFKMMNVMMAVMGVMFYFVPAGLCVYFIASSLWGICERKLLDRHKRTLEERKAALGAEGVDPGEGGKRTDSPAAPKEPGFLSRLLEAADKAKHPTNGQGGKDSRPDRKSGRGSKSRR